MDITVKIETEGVTDANNSVKRGGHEKVRLKNFREVSLNFEVALKHLTPLSLTAVMETQD